MMSTQKIVISCLDRVLVCNYRGSSCWLPGIIKTVLGPILCQVELNDGRLWKRHLDQLLKDQPQVNDSQIDKDIIDFPVTEPSPTQPTGTAENSPVRQSSRARRPPDKLTM